MKSTFQPLRLTDVQAELAAVDAELGRHGHTEAAAEHRHSMRQLRDRFEHRLQLLTSAYDAATSLASLSSPSELLLRVPATLTSGAGFRRVLLSRIDGDVLLPLSAHFIISGDADIDADLADDVLARLRESPVRLAHNLIESDVIRRRRASLVTDAERNRRAATRIREAIGWSSCVVAPIVSGPTTIGLIHADRGPTSELDVSDRDAIGEFASVVSHLHESADLRRTLRQEREEVRRLLDRMTALSTALIDTPVTLRGYDSAGTLVRPPISVAEMRSGGDEDDRLVFSGLLTKRELEVLRLLADGGTNHAIANALVLSDTTVKFHVNSILRKLHVANRAQAVARYLALVGVSAAQ